MGRSWPLRRTNHDDTGIIDSSNGIVTSREAPHITVMAGCLNLLATPTSWENGSVQRRIRRTNQHGVSGPEHDTWNDDWDESSWDSTTNWGYEPQDSAALLLELLPATHNRRVDCLSSVSESDDGDLHATMSAMQSAARTFTEAWDPLNRVRTSRGDYRIVGLGALLAIENAGKGV